MDGRTGLALAHGEVYSHMYFLGSCGQVSSEGQRYRVLVDATYVVHASLPR